ncbi:MAG: hypothetical protein IPP47_33795 [Bryobacterales bacterium]|nr:hypothetical protein [Bryobacterales bacterium]
MTRQSLSIALALLLLTLLGFFYFPGHTWLQADTQIYAPILDRMDDPSLFSKDMVALRPHVTWTLYDESAIALHRITGLSFQTVLQSEQVLFRLVGLFGVYLLAGALGLGSAGALLVTGCFGLGATINGPAVLTLEYEPVPRAFAILLVLGALGCVSRRWWWAAGVLAGVATLFHPTTTAPVWFCLGLWWLLRREERAAMRPLLISLAAAVGIVLLFALLQRGETERQPLIGRIGPELERVQRLRGSYNWIDLWLPEWFWQYPLLLIYVALAWRRLRGVMSPGVAFLTLALPLFGLVMVPVQYLLLDVGKWILIPQFQPARGVLFITVMAILLGAAAGWRAAQNRLWLESAAWFVVVFAIPSNGLVVQLFTQMLWVRIGLVALFAALAMAAARWRVVLPVAMLAPFLLIPTVGGLETYPRLHTRPMQELSAWARENTAKDDVFLFADAYRGYQPGVFRGEAQRAIYVDWKGGGQANLLPGLGEEWWRRWQAVHMTKPPLLPLDAYRGLGIDYLVVRAASRPAGVVYANEEWAVIPLKPAR